MAVMGAVAATTVTTCWNFSALLPQTFCRCSILCTDDTADMIARESVTSRIRVDCMKSRSLSLLLSSVLTYLYVGVDIYIWRVRSEWPYQSQIRLPRRAVSNMCYSPHRCCCCFNNTHIKFLLKEIRWWHADSPPHKCPQQGKMQVGRLLYDCKHIITKKRQLCCVCWQNLKRSIYFSLQHSQFRSPAEHGLVYNNIIIIQHLYSAIVSYAGCRGSQSSLFVTFLNVFSVPCAWLPVSLYI